MPKLATSTRTFRATAAGRARRASGSNDSFRQFVQDQLSALPDVKCRSMFGGSGLYKGETFFGIIFNGQLFFKTEPATRTRYVEMGMKPFQPNEKQTLKSYYGVPVDIIEDREQLTAWALEAAGAQTRKNRS